MPNRKRKIMDLSSLYDKMMNEIENNPELSEMKKDVAARRAIGRSLKFTLNTSTSITTVESLPEANIFDQLEVV